MKKDYLSLFKDKIRIGKLTDNWGDKIFGLSLDNGRFDYNQLNLKWIYICWLKEVDEE